MSTVPAEEGSAVGLRIFLALAAFFLLLAVVYAATSDGEWAGAALLALSAGLSLLTGGFLFLVERRGGLRQELDPA
ncbi:MAG: cytochrome c oxidase subunit 4, partial [Acidimicrobiales bacterium]